MNGLLVFPHLAAETHLHSEVTCTEDVFDDYGRGWLLYHSDDVTRTCYVAYTPKGFIARDTLKKGRP